MTKYTNFHDIPKLNKLPAYACDIGWDFVEEWIAMHENLDLEPDFQRDYVWTREQQISYVEFCLQGGVSARNLFFNCLGYKHRLDNPMTIIDGKQRLAAARAYVAGEFAAFGETTWDDVKKTCVFEQSVGFRINVVEMTRDETLRWYVFMNGGGTPHTRADLERARALIGKSTPVEIK